MHPIDPPNEKSGRARRLRRLPLLLWLVPLACLAGAAARMAHNRYPTGWDSDMHARNAIALRQLAHESPADALLFLRRLPLRYPPLTYALTAALLSVSFSPWAHHITILALDILFFLFFALSLRALKLRAGAALLGLLAVCANPRLAVNLCSYNLEMALTAATMFLTWLWLTQPWRRSARAAVWCGLAAGVALLSKTVILPFFALLVAIEIFAPLPGVEEKRKRRLAVFVAVAGGVAALYYLGSASGLMGELTGDLRGFKNATPEPWWRYAAVLVAGLGGLPLFLATALSARQIAWRRLPAAGRLAAMAALWLLFFSLFATKRPWYAIGPYCLLVLALAAALNSAEGKFARRVTAVAAVLYAVAATLFWFPQTRAAAVAMAGVADRDIALPPPLAAGKLKLDGFPAMLARTANCRTFVIDPSNGPPPVGLKTVLSFALPDAVIGGGFVALPSGIAAGKRTYSPDVCAVLDVPHNNTSPQGAEGSPADKYETATLFLQTAHGRLGSDNREESRPAVVVSAFDAFLLFNEYLPQTAVRDRLRDLRATGHTAQALAEYRNFLPMRRDDNRVWNEFFDCFADNRTPPSERQAIAREIDEWIAPDDAPARETCLRRLCGLEAAGKIAGRCEPFAALALAGPTVDGDARFRLLQILLEFFLQTGQDGQAADLLDRESPASAVALALHFADTSRTAGHFDRAIEVFQLALRRQPNDPAALAGLIGALRAGRRPEEEAAALEHLLETLPVSAVVLSERFDRLFELGDHASCLRWIARTFAEEPDGSPSRARALELLLRRPFRDELRERVDGLLASNLPPPSSSEMPATLWDWAQTAWDAGNTDLAERLHNRIADNSAFGDACRRLAQSRADLLRAGAGNPYLQRGVKRGDGLLAVLHHAAAAVGVSWRSRKLTSENRALLADAAPWSRLTGVCLDEIAVVKARNCLAGGEYAEARRWLAEVTHDGDLRETAAGIRRSLPK